MDFRWLQARMASAEKDGRRSLAASSFGRFVSHRPFLRVSEPHDLPACFEASRCTGANPQGKVSLWKEDFSLKNG